MALLHYLLSRGKDSGILVSALNCDHGMRGADSERDSAFVAAYCKDKGVPLHFFKAESGAFKDENGARKWRLECYKSALGKGDIDCIATAHHKSDNAETVLFNLARGASVSGVCGIGDEPNLGIIRPLIGCSREEIDLYIEQNGVPYVVDESNFTCDYTRNVIRHKVLPELEDAVHGAVDAIYRFSRLAREDEEYFSRQVDNVIVNRGEGNYLIKACAERAIFKRAAGRIVAEYFGKRDYTAEQLESVFALQNLGNGKRFEFLGLTAIKESGGVALTQNCENERCETLFAKLLSGELNLSFAGGSVRVLADTGCAFGDGKRDTGEVFAANEGQKALLFDVGKIPENAVVRFRRAGDKFRKFGGVNLSLSDFLTDKKVPQGLRGALPLVCSGSEVLIVGGIEISEKIKVTDGTKSRGVFICKDPFKLV